MAKWLHVPGQGQIVRVAAEMATDTPKVWVSVCGCAALPPHKLVILPIIAMQATGNLVTASSFHQPLLSFGPVDDVVMQNRLALRFPRPSFPWLFF